MEPGSGTAVIISRYSHQVQLITSAPSRKPISVHLMPYRLAMYMIHAQPAVNSISPVPMAETSNQFSAFSSRISASSFIPSRSA